MFIGDALLRFGIGDDANTGGEDETLLLNNGQGQEVTANRGEGRTVDLFKAFVQFEGGNLIATILLIVVGILKDKKGRK